MKIAQIAPLWKACRLGFVLENSSRDLESHCAERNRQHDESQRRAA